MTKSVDQNGYWSIKENPITKEGVFPYMGYQISDELEPNKIYKVYRPENEITSKETIESFEAVPLIDEHEMLGNGFTKYDNRPAGGVLYNIKKAGNKLIGDLKIFSEKIKNEIENGKKELSLGYRCKYELIPGTFNGEPYDAIQKNIRGNHIALVSRGRMGSEVRVYDHAKIEERFTMDEMPIGIDSDLNTSKGNCSDNTNGENDMELIEKIRELIKAEELPAEEKLNSILKLLETPVKVKVETDEETKPAEPEKKPDEKPASPSEPADEKKPEEKTGDECGKEPKTKDEAKEADTKEKDPEKTTDECGTKMTGDSMKAILKEISLRENIKKEVEPLIGSFSCDEWNADETAMYACKKLGLAATEKDAQAVLRGYMAGKKNSEKHFGMDSAPKSIDRSQDVATLKYFKKG